MASLLYGSGLRFMEAVHTTMIHTHLRRRDGLPPYSHSIVPGGLPVTSYTTREIPSTSLTMRDETQHLVRQVSPAGGHEVDGFDSADDNHVLVATAVAHDADAGDGQIDRKCLADLVLPAEVAQLFDADGVGSGTGDSVLNSRPDED